MRFKIISHASFLLEHEGKKLLVDPWIIGSCYWRSWWHFPEAVPLDDDILSTDYIYITHQHFDHFHYPSLRKFNRNLKMLVPQLPQNSMVLALQDLGFKNIVEMPHGETLQLADSLALTSYQATWWHDSALVIKAGKTTLLDLNDAKFEDVTFAKILKKHQPIDFMFRSHSSAQAYPDCFSSTDPSDLNLRKKEDYVNDFIKAAKRCQTRYAVPFASNVCFLHDQTFTKNEAVVDPLQLTSAYQQTSSDDPEIKIMFPGSTWDENLGFDCVSTDVLDRKSTILKELRLKNQSKLIAQAQEEAKIVLKYETFEDYMGRFINSLPWALRLVYHPKIAFQILEHHEWWGLDFGKQTLFRTKTKPLDAASIITVDPAVLQDAMEKSIVNFIDISKRLQIELKPGQIFQHLIFQQLIVLFEMGNFPLNNNLNVRFAKVWFARRDELLSYFLKLFRGMNSYIPQVKAK